MVELLLPRNSKIQKGQTFKPKALSDKFLKPIEIYRWDRSDDQNRLLNYVFCEKTGYNFNKSKWIF